MAVFAYKGLDARGKAVAGVKEAEGAKALRGLLRKDGVFLTELREEAARGQKKSPGVDAGKGLQREVDLAKYFERIKVGEVAVFTRQLATLLKAGIPLTEAMAALAEQVENPKFRRMLGDIRQQINEGGSLAGAMGKHPEVFETLYVNMVSAGEAAGNLDAVLSRLADFQDAQISLKNKVSAAMTYPVIMVVIGAGIISLLMVTVVPNLTRIFADTGQALPWNTQLLIFMSTLAADWWFLLLPAMGLGVWMFRRWKSSPVGKPKWDAFSLRMPVFGSLTRMIAVSRFSKTLGTMLQSGVPILRALDIVRAIVGNVVLEKVIEDARVAIQEGESLAAPLKKSKQFPPLVTHMIAVGERSGQLEQMLENVAMAYDREVELKVTKMTSLLEPMMILFMGGGIGFIVWSILGPIMEMNNWVGQ